MSHTVRLTETGRSTAQSYHYRGTVTRADGTEYAEGWAICTVNDQTGELAIQSDWTDGCAFRWHTAHLGAPTLTHFIAEERGRYYDYFVGKLLSTERAQQFSPRRTVKVMREFIVHKRREHDIGKETARELWNELRHLEHKDDIHEFFEDVSEVYRDRICQHPEFECALMEPTTEALAIANWIMPALAQSCREELARRGEVPASAEGRGDLAGVEVHTP